MGQSCTSGTKVVPCDRNGVWQKQEVSTENTASIQIKQTSDTADDEMASKGLMADVRSSTMKLEPSPPDKEVAVYAAPVPRQAEFESQTDNVTMATQKESVGSGNLTLELPLPNNYSGGPLKVFVRTLPTDSDVEDDVGARREVEVQEGYITCPRMTAVEESSKQYLKRGDRKCFFFVAARELESCRECHEVLVVVTSRTHREAEFERHLTERYCLLYVSEEFLTRPPTRFLLSVMGNMFIHKGEREAKVTFREMLLQNDTTNHALFTIRCMSRDDFSQGRISVHQERKEAKKGQHWEYKGELRFDLSRIEQFWRLEMNYPFTDQLLLDLVDRLYLSESRELGIRLGLLGDTVDSIISNHHLTTPVIKCFEILRRRRDRCIKMVQFGRNLVAALRDMDWNRQCEWLLEQLAEWPQRAEIEPQEGT